jgi:hypothetical protein
MLSPRPLALPASWDTTGAAAVPAALRAHAAMPVRRPGLASRTAAQRAAVIAIQDDRLDRLLIEGKTR